MADILVLPPEPNERVFQKFNKQELYLVAEQKYIEMDDLIEAMNQNREKLKLASLTPKCPLWLLLIPFLWTEFKKRWNMNQRHAVRRTILGLCLSKEGSAPHFRMKHGDKLEPEDVLEGELKEKLLNEQGTGMSADLMLSNRDGTGTVVSKSLTMSKAERAKQSYFALTEEGMKYKKKLEEKADDLTL